MAASASPALARDLQDVADDVVAEAAADVGPEGLAVAVGEVARVAELRDLGQLLPLGRVAHPHRGVGIDGADRQVLRHALDEPQGQAQRAGQSRPQPSWPVMSNWKACTSSWPSTWSVSASGPAKGSTTRRFRASVTPPVDSPGAPPRTFVCSNSGWLP